LTRQIAANPEAIDGTAARGKLAALVEPEAVDEQQRAHRGGVRVADGDRRPTRDPGDHFTTR
jgi:hypothetical protein